MHVHVEGRIILNTILYMQQYGDGHRNLVQGQMSDLIA